MLKVRLFFSPVKRRNALYISHAEGYKMRGHVDIIYVKKKGALSPK